MVKVLVCGGRKFDDYDSMCTFLGHFHAEHGITRLIQGGATGADFLARRWAENNFIPYQEYKADWKRYGNRAGPLRNQKMLDIEDPDFVIAFPGGAGTADMVKRRS